MVSARPAAPADLLATGDEGITAMTYTMQANEFRSQLFRAIGRAVER